MIKLYVNKNNILLPKCVFGEKITSGSQSTTYVKFDFSNDWDSLSKIATFKARDISIDIPEDDWIAPGGGCYIPAEVMEIPGRVVRVGITGYSNTDSMAVVLPTVWAELGKVERGAAPSGTAPSEEGLPMWAKIIDAIGDVDSFKDNTISDTISYIKEEVSSKTDSKRIYKNKDYLYTMYCRDIDYKKANEYFDSGNATGNISACSSVRNENYYGRNLDWFYNNSAEFAVITPRIDGRYASIGMAGNVPELTEEFMESGEYSPLFEIVPFRMFDGINECGLTANVNVTPIDDGDDGVEIYNQDNSVRISGIMLIRYLLDHCKSVSEAVDCITNDLAVYFPAYLKAANYKLHFMLADDVDTYCIEFNNGASVAIDISDHPYLTNFTIDGITRNDDGTVYTPATQDDEHDAYRTNSIAKDGSGLERYNQIVENYASANTATGMRSLMDGLKYTRTYSTSDNPSNPFWFTEYVNGDNYSVDTPADDFEDVVEKYGNIYLNRTRDNPIAWHTVHSVVFDILRKKMSVIVQEDGDTIEYTLDVPNNADAPVTSVNGQTGDVELDASDVGALPISGGTMTGDVNFGRKFLRFGQTELYEDSDNRLRIDVNNFETEIVVGEGGIGGIRSVEYSDSATSKAYVDDAVGDVSDSVSAIEGKIPAQATSTNQLADKDFVNSSIENVAAYFITKDAAGNPFATKAELTVATVFYSGGQVRVPTRNDYTVVLADESKTISATGENPTTRYIYDNNVWSFQYIVNNSGLTAAQWEAVNSGITSSILQGLASETWVQGQGYLVADADDAPTGVEMQNVYKDTDGNLVTPVGSGGGGGTLDHRQLTNRDAADQHPISSISGSGSSSTNARTSDLYMGNHAIHNVTDANPANNLDAVNVQFMKNNIPQATDAKFGGIKAAARDASTDTQEVKIDTASGKLYVPQSSGTQEVFFAKYNETLNTQIAAAYLAGKLIFCRYNKSEYALTMVNNETAPTSFTFVCPFIPSANKLICTSLGWSLVETNMEQTAFKISALTPQYYQDETRYTSAKAVVDYVSAAIGNAIGGAY